MEIKVEYNDYKLADYIKGIAQTVLDYFSLELNLKPKLGEKQILINYNSISPIVYWPLKPDVYEIGLKIKGFYPLQIIFQLAHELTHIYIDPRINGPVIEVLCHLMAIKSVLAIGHIYTPTGKIDHEKYVAELKNTAQTKSKTSLSDVELQKIISMIKVLENKGSKYSRSINNLIAFRLMEILNETQVLTFIQNLSQAVIPLSANDKCDLATNANVKLNTSHPLIQSLLYQTIKY